MTNLVLVRHGESNVMHQGIVGGLKSCTGLDDLGRAQAAALAARWSASGEMNAATVLYASTYPRAQETAQILRPSIGAGDLEMRIDAGFCELDPGDADGMDWKQASEKFNAYGDAWDPFIPWAPNAESWATFCDRVAHALVSCADRHPGETVVIACHGGVVDAAFRHSLRLGITGQYDLWTLNTSVSEFRLDHAQRRWALLRYNDHAHLQGDLRHK